MTTLRNIKTGGSTRLTRQNTILLDRNFNIGPYHVLREICQKFDRVSSVKRTSLYFKNRARPAIKHTSNIHKVPQLRLGLQTTVFAQPSAPNNSSPVSNQNIKILITIKII